MNGKRGSPRWSVVLRPDGVVDAVHGGAPTTWVGRRLIEVRGTSGALRRAASELVHTDPGPHYLHRRTVQCESVSGPFEVDLLLVEGLPLRRSHARVSELIMRTLEAFASQAQASGVDLTVDQAPNVPPALLLDGEKIAWALATLVGNALRYAAQREALSERAAAHVHVSIGWDAPERAMVVRVSDNGPGMSERIARGLFEPDPLTGKTSGVALPMVRDVMSAHRGTITVDSKLGHGTTVTLRIPSLER